MVMDAGVHRMPQAERFAWFDNQTAMSPIASAGCDYISGQWKAFVYAAERDFATRGNSDELRAE